MEQLKEDEGEGKRPGSRYADISRSVRSRGVGSYGKWELQMGKTSFSHDRHEHHSAGDQSEPQRETTSPSHDRRGHDSADDQSELHEPKVVQLNLKSSLMGLRIMNDDDELFFSRQSPLSSMLSEKFRCTLPLEQPKAKNDIPGPRARTPSGVLYPCPNPGRSCQLDAALFTFDSNLLTPSHEASTSGGGGSDVTEHIFQELVGQSRLAKPDNLSVSPVSTLHMPQSPTSSERSFRAASKRKSLRRRSDDAAAVMVDAATPRPKSDLAHYLMSISAFTEDAINDDDDLEGPSEVAWLEPEDNNSYHPDLPVIEGYTSKKKPTHERWSSNSSSWNLSLVQKPLRTVSTIVRRQHHTIPGRKSNRRGKVEAIITMSSYDGGTVRSRKGDRTWFGSGRRSSVFGCSGRLQMEVAAEPDLFEPDMEQANNVEIRAPCKVDEDDFPFENPIASTFVFHEVDKAQSTDLHKAVVSVIDSENDELLFSDNYHDPDDGSLSDSDNSHAFSDANCLDRLPQWVSSRSLDYVRDIAVSGCVLSGFLDVARSGRFSVDLQRSQKLDKVQHPRTPDVRLRIFKTEKSSKRSILSPCLPFLHRSHSRQHRVPRKQAPAAGASMSRRLQPVNSFTARLGPVSESNSKLAAQFQLQ